MKRVKCLDKPVCTILSDVVDHTAGHSRQHPREQISPSVGRDGHLVVSLTGSFTISGASVTGFGRGLFLVRIGFLISRHREQATLQLSWVVVDAGTTWTVHFMPTIGSSVQSLGILFSTKILRQSQRFGLLQHETHFLRTMPVTFLFLFVFEKAWSFQPASSRRLFPIPRC